jgi:hypothetical protein
MPAGAPSMGESATSDSRAASVLNATVKPSLFAVFAGLFPRLALFIVSVARPALVAAAFCT